MEREIDQEEETVEPNLSTEANSVCEKDDGMVPDGGGVKKTYVLYCEGIVIQQRACDYTMLSLN